MTISKEMKDDVRGWIDETLEHLSCTEIRGKLKVLWNSRFTSKMGDARFNCKTGECRVRFSVKLWPRASQDERRQTVIHEICHIVVHHNANLNGKRVTRSHGHEWQCLMIECGLKPDLYHKVDTSGLSRRTIISHCLCGEHRLTPYKAGRIADGASLQCAKCKVLLSVPEGTKPISRRKPRKKKSRQRRIG